MYEQLEKLKGLTIKKVFITKEKNLIAFITNVGMIAYYVEGDCCSKSWVEHINGIKNIINNVVIDISDSDAVSDVEIEDEHGEYHECLSYYHSTIKTAAGSCDIEYRNSSNGYYGGLLVEITDETIKNHWAKLIDELNVFDEITNDF